MNALSGITALLCLGMAAQWLAWRLNLPSILLLLIFGFFAGPGWLDLGIAELFPADLLFPLISASVAIILFEGGLSLRMSELRSHGRIVLRLISVGAAVTWVLTALAAHWLAGLPWDLALLLGAILVVSGPTVVLPLLRQVNPRGRVGPILKWEGIAIDPIGAVLAVLVFEGIEHSGLGQATGFAVLGFLKTLVVGTAGGVLGGAVLVQMLKRYWIPDHLHSPITLSIVVAVFAGTNAIQHECGLLTVTVMGFYAANRASVSLRHIMEFKENLRVLLISGLFLLLASRVTNAQLATLDLGAFAFLGALLLVVRPLAVLAAARGSKLDWREKVFLAWLCPRGIVAAAIASVFGLSLTEIGRTDAEALVPLTFLVIVGTVVVYGLTARPLAKRLGLAIPNPQGVLFVGAHSWAREIAAALQKEGIAVLMVDSNRRNVAKARMEELPVRQGNALEPHVEGGLDLAPIGRVLALTPNDEVNTLISLHFRHEFGRSEIYQLAADTMPAKGRKPQDAKLGGRLLFSEVADYFYLTARRARGRVRVTQLTEQFDYAAFRAHYGERAVLLGSISENGNLTIATVDQPLKPSSKARIVALVEDASEEGEAPPPSGGLKEPSPAAVQDDQPGPPPT